MSKNEKEYVDKLAEWQEHQYDPGHYTGGNFPIEITHPLKLKWTAIVFYTIPAIASLFVAVLIFFAPLLDTTMTWEFSNRLPAIIIFGGISALYFRIGYRYRMKDHAAKLRSTQMRKKHKRKKIDD